MDLLAEEFDKNPEWTKERLLELSKLTGLTEAQIYKWGWDQRRKKEMDGPDGTIGTIKEKRDVSNEDQTQTEVRESENFDSSQPLLFTS